MGSGVFKFRSIVPATKFSGSLDPTLEQWQQICETVENQTFARDQPVEVDVAFARMTSHRPTNEPASGAVISPWAQALLLATLRWPVEDPDQIRALHAWLNVASPEALTPFWDLLLSGLLAEDDGPGWMEPAALVLAQIDSAWRHGGDGLSLMEWWEQTFNPQQRKQFGVFHTPRELAEEAWSRIPSDHWQLPKSGWILDPAAGTQVFACAALSQIAKCHDSTTFSLDSALQAPNANAAKLDRMREFLGRFVTLEISPLAWILGFLEVARTLQEYGDDWSQPPQLHFWLADALQASAETGDAKQQQDLRRQDYRWVVGNPPYSSRVENHNPWILSLLKGQVEGPGGDVSYYEVQGEPLNERKSWLHDLYVCFFRKAQWWTHLSERAGIVFVTNRGFIDNVTFRGMRESLGDSFPRIELYELQSPRSLSENREPGQSSHGGWFGIKTSTCLAVLQRESLHSKTSPQVRWRAPIVADATAGPSEEGRIQDSVEPTAPEYEWHPEAYVSRREFERGWCLTTLFQNSGSPIVTARDALAIAFSPQELVSRIQEMGEGVVPDETLRQRYFSRARSRRYVAGDTRGWTLKGARESLRRRMDAGWEISTGIRPVHYRAFDLRYVAWLDELIDWPRHQVMATLETGEGWALIARRQSPLDRAANYVTATRNLVVDGILRSDNRGNETVFPLQWLDPYGSKVSNLNGTFKSAWRRLVSRANGDLFCVTTSSDRALPDADSKDAVLDEHLLGYLFAWLNCTEYQERFRHQLVRRYPRVPLVNLPEWVWKMSEAGLKLLRLHAMTTFEIPGENAGSDRQTHRLPSRDLPDAAGLARGFPQFRENQIILGDNLPRFNASSDVWGYQVGAHQIAMKWLRDRRSTVGQKDTLQQYDALLRRLQATVDQKKRIDQWVEAAGGVDRLYRDLVGPEETSAASQ